MKLILIIIAALALAAIIWFYYNLKQNTKTTQPVSEELSIQDFLNHELLRQLQTSYPQFTFSLDGNKITSTLGITLKAQSLNHRKYVDSESFQVNFYTSHKAFEPFVEERLSGAGENTHAALINGVSSFLTGQFPTIVAALELRHAPEIDFDIIGEKGKTHWHPLVGDIQLQGEMAITQHPEIYDTCWNMLKPFFEAKLKSSNKAFHWFRYYIGRMPNGELMGDCYYDNEPDEQALEIIKQYAETWKVSGFAGQKQFIMFRSCGE